MQLLKRRETFRRSCIMSTLNGNNYLKTPDQEIDKHKLGEEIDI